MLVVAIIAIVFVGPKELPGMLRTFGQAIKKVRAMAGDFQGQFNDALKEAELDGVKNAIDDVRSLDPTKAIKDKLNPLKSDLEKPAAQTPNRTAQEIEAEIAQDYADAQAAVKANNLKSSGKNAVPGFSSDETDVEIVKTETASSKVVADSDGDKLVSEDVVADVKVAESKPNKPSAESA